MMTIPPSSCLPEVDIRLHNLCVQVYCRLAECAVAQAYSVPIEALRSSRRGVARVCGPRQIALYLAHRCFALEFTEIGRAYGRDRTTVRHAVHQIQKKRDQNNSIDWQLSVLEQAIISLSRSVNARQ